MSMLCDSGCLSTPLSLQVWQISFSSVTSVLQDQREDQSQES